MDKSVLVIKKRHDIIVFAGKERAHSRMKQKVGRKLLISGAIILLIALLLLFNTTSPWALITLALSIVVNTAGVSFLLIK